MYAYPSIYLSIQLSIDASIHVKFVMCARGIYIRIYVCIRVYVCISRAHTLRISIPPPTRAQVEMGWECNGGENLKADVCETLCGNAVPTFGAVV